MSVEAAAREQDQLMLGLLFGSAAFLTWGLQPIYFKAVAEVPALEMLALRVVWAAAFMALAVIVVGRWSELRRILGDMRIYGILVATASLIATNWLVFIWAVANAHVVQCSLGFFMTPLVNVALGVVFLRERLRRRQLLAIGLAAAAVVLLMINAGEIPWIALTLAITFGLYGLLRKLRSIEAVIAVTVEMFLLTPIALAYLIYLASADVGAFVPGDWADNSLLASSGILTAVPLVWYAAAARRLPLSTIGLLQYIAPTGQLALGVLLWGEPFTFVHGVAFIAIWAALGLYTTDIMRAQVQARDKRQAMRS